QCMLVGPSKRTVATAAKNRLPPMEPARYAAPETVTAMASAAIIATPANPAKRCTPPKTASDNHSHANQGEPSRVYEKRSTRGTAAVLRMASPLRTCHPVSLSRNSRGTPAERNNTCRSVTVNTTPTKLGRSQTATEFIPARSAVDWGEESSA